MIKTMYYIFKNRKGELTWSQIIMAIITLIILAIMFYVSLKSKNDMGGVTEKLDGFLS